MIIFLNNTLLRHYLQFRNQTQFLEKYLLPLHTETRTDPCLWIVYYPEQHLSY